MFSQYQINLLTLLMSVSLSYVLSALRPKIETKIELIYLVKILKQGYQIANKVFSDVGLMAKFKNVLKSLLSGRYLFDELERKKSNSPRKKTPIQFRTSTSKAITKKDGSSLNLVKQSNIQIRTSSKSPDPLIHKSHYPAAKRLRDFLHNHSENKIAISTTQKNSKRPQTSTVLSLSANGKERGLSRSKVRVEQSSSPLRFDVELKSNKELKIRIDTIGSSSSSSRKKNKRIRYLTKSHSNKNRNTYTQTATLKVTSKSYYPEVTPSNTNSTSISFLKPRIHTMNEVNGFNQKISKLQETRHTISNKRLSMPFPLEELPDDTQHQSNFEKEKVPISIGISQNEPLIFTANGYRSKAEYLLTTPTMSHLSPISNIYSRATSLNKTHHSSKQKDLSSNNISIYYDYNLTSDNSKIDLERFNNLMEIRESGSSPINLPTRQQHSITAKKTSEIGLKPVKPSKFAIIQSTSFKPNLDESNLQKVEELNFEEECNNGQKDITGFAVDENMQEKAPANSQEEDETSSIDHFRYENKQNLVSQNKATTSKRDIYETVLDKLEEVSESSQMMDEKPEVLVIKSEVEQPHIATNSALNSGEMNSRTSLFERGISIDEKENAESNDMDNLSKNVERPSLFAMNNLSLREERKKGFKQDNICSKNSIREISEVMEKKANYFVFKSPKKSDKKLPDKLNMTSIENFNKVRKRGPSLLTKLVLNNEKMNDGSISEGSNGSSRDKKQGQVPKLSNITNGLSNIRTPGGDRKNQRSSIKVESPRRKALRFRSCMQGGPQEESQNESRIAEREAHFKNRKKLSHIMNRNSKLNESRSMVIDQNDITRLNIKLKPNTLIIDKEKLKENFKGESVTVVRTHTIESYNQTVSCYIVAKQKPESQEFVFEINAYISENYDDAENTSSDLSKMRIIPTILNETEFIERLCELQLAYINLTPNFILINQNMEWLLKLFVSRFLRVKVDVETQTIIPSIHDTPFLLYTSDNIPYNDSMMKVSLVHNNSTNFWLILHSQDTNK